MPEIEILARTQNELGESPIYDARSNTLWWVDLLKGDLWSRTRDRVDCVPLNAGPITGIGLSVNPNILVASFEREFGCIDITQKRVTRAARPAIPKNMRFNDGTVSPDGAWVSGTLPYDSVAGNAEVWSWAGTRTIRGRGGLGLSNGMAWSLSGQQLFHVDSLEKSVCVSVLDKGRLRLIDRWSTERFAGSPDGIAIDDGGNLWVCMWQGGLLVSFSPSGLPLSIIELPVRQPTSCCFLPNGLLAVTTARYDMPSAEMEEYPLSGSVLAVHVGTGGPPPYLYAGLFGGPLHLQPTKTGG